MTAIPYLAYLPILITVSAVAAYEAVLARAGWSSRVVLASLALFGFYEAAAVAVHSENVSLSMLAYWWKPFGVALLVFILASTVAISEWLHRFGRWPWTGTVCAISGGVLAWHLVTEIMGC